MRKLVWVMALAIALSSCSNSFQKVVRKVDRMEYLKQCNPTQYEVESHGCKTYMEYMDTLDKELKDWPFPNAHGNYLIMRSSDPEPPDTIVDGIGYKRDC